MFLRYVATALLFAFVINAVLSALADTHQEHPEQHDSFDPFHRYSRVTSLFEHIHPSHFSTEEQKASEINRIKTEMLALSHRLLKEEHSLRALRVARDQEKTSLLWFFDSDTRHRVERAQLLVNDQIRTIENIAEDIEFHWKQLKPIYGLYSKLFLAELLGFFPDLLISAFRLFSSSLSLGLLSLLIFGPVAFFLVAFWFAFGMFLLPFVLFGVAVYWLFHLPVVMIEYNPSLLEFASVYLPILALFIFALQYFLKSEFTPKRHHPRPHQS